MPTLTPTQIN